MRRRVYQLTNGEDYVELLPENDEDRALIEQMRRDGKIDDSDWLHREPPSGMRKRPEQKKTA